MKEDLILGIDIGGSHITAGLVDLEKSLLKTQSVVRGDMDSFGSLETILNQMGEVISPLLHTPHFYGKIAIAFPGPFDYQNGIPLIEDQGKFKSLYKKNLGMLLAKNLDIDGTEIKFFNDAACFLQGEVFSGLGKHHPPVLGLTLGTGLGSAIYTGQYAKDAALWKFPFLDGISEDYLSTKWFVDSYLLKSGKAVSGVKELAALYPTDPLAQEIFQTFGTNLGLFIAELVKREGVELIVLGGSITKSFNCFQPALSAHLRNSGIEVPIKISMLGELSALIGAASLFSSYLKV